MLMTFISFNQFYPQSDQSDHFARATCNFPDKSFNTICCSMTKHHCIFKGLFHFSTKTIFSISVGLLIKF